MFFYHPERESWEFGDREIVCFFGLGEGKELSESLRGDAAAMADEVLRYLEITTPLEMVLWDEPVAGSLRERRAWASEMAASIDREARALGREDWPASIAGLVTELIAHREASVAYWERAASAASQGDFDEEHAGGFGSLGVETEIEIRETLGLTTGE
jgi:hypothetical protein